MRVRLASVGALVTLVGLASASPSARADGSSGSSERGMTLPAGGGLDAIDVKVDSRGHLRFRRCKGASCDDSTPWALDLAIPIEVTRLDMENTKFQNVPIGEGRRVVHVRVPDRQRKDLVFEALFSGQSNEPIFSGLTGYTRGDDGDRAGDVVLIYDRDAQSKFVIVAEAREDTRICGQAVTPLGARGLDAHTMQLRGASLHRIDKAARDGAERIVATARPEGAPAPLARVLAATGGSAPRAPALTDGDPKTAWVEQRPGDGHGEFVTMRVPAELPLKGLVVTPAPSANQSAAGAAPRTFFVATDARLFQITMPEDAWSKPGQAYDIPLPEGVKTTCLALVLDESYTRGQSAPEVAVAELAAITSFDVEKASLDDVAKALSGTRAEEAAALLRRAGDEGLAAVVKRYDALDGRARALAIDVAASAGTCAGPAAELLTRALTDADLEVRKRALGRLERCGKNAGDALVLAVRGTDEARRAAAAPLLATVAPALAIEPLAEQMGKGSSDTRRSVRAAFARAAGVSTHDKLLGLLANRELPAPARLDLLRAMGGKLPDLRPESDLAIADILKSSPDMATRWLVVQPLSMLARSKDATTGELSRLAELARRDPEWAVRARAVELATGIGPLLSTVIQSTVDPEPRVREAALKSLAQFGAASGEGAAAQALAKDEWTFVRVAAAEALGAMPGAPASAPALAAALADASPKVRWAAVAALGKQRATALAPRVRERLDDAKEDADVRALAAKTLGTMCARGEVDRLTKLAQRSTSPVDEADDRVGMAAIEALGAIHPTDLAKRLAPLREKNVRPPVRRAAERALAEPGGCN